MFYAIYSSIYIYIYIYIYKRWQPKRSKALNMKTIVEKFNFLKKTGTIQWNIRKKVVIACN